MQTVQTKPRGKRGPLPVTRNTAFLSVSQLAERYSVHPDTIWRWVKRGDFPPPFYINSQVAPLVAG
jgi:hypothetical protein